MESALASVVLPWGSWVLLGLKVSPPNLQRQQPVVVGDSVLSRREEAEIDSHVIFVPVETRWSVAGSVVLIGKDPEFSDWISTLALGC